MKKPRADRRAVAAALLEEPGLDLLAQALRHAKKRPSDPKAMRNALLAIEILARYVLDENAGDADPISETWRALRRSIPVTTGRPARKPG